MTIEEVKDLLPGDVVRAKTTNYAYIYDYKVVDKFVKNGTHYIRATCCEKNRVSDRIYNIPRSYISKLVSYNHGGDHIKVFNERIKACKKEITKQKRAISDYENKINWMKSNSVNKFDEKLYKADLTFKAIMNPELSDDAKKDILLKFVK